MRVRMGGNGSVLWLQEPGLFVGPGSLLRRSIRLISIPALNNLPNHTKVGRAGRSAGGSPGHEHEG